MKLVRKIKSSCSENWRFRWYYGRIFSSPMPVKSSSGRNGVDRSGCLEEEAVEAIVEAALDRKMSSLMKLLSSIEESLAVGLDDVMAGIGYILGRPGLRQEVRA
ncbi:MAG: hypothetical protein ACLFS7_09125 [Desulfosudaceae bacterium]